MFYVIFVVGNSTFCVVPPLFSEFLKSSEHTRRLIKPRSVVSMNDEEQEEACEAGKVERVVHIVSFESL